MYKLYCVYYYNARPVVGYLKGYKTLNGAKKSKIIDILNSEYVTLFIVKDNEIKQINYSGIWETYPLHECYYYVPEQVQHLKEYLSKRG